MAIDDTRTYNGITREVFDRLKAGLSNANISFPELDSGSISSHGLTGEFRYNESAQTLMLTVVKYPFLAPKAMVWTAIEGAVIRAKR
ncbi:MAG: hypothetical protein M3160_01310 [Candidatus Eremiobacteraeota bacterium]|nr:hypothetical protein [Candidatus Eremiobacteraeota bacterium]